MFEINPGTDALFRLTFIERMKEPEDHDLDLINCWLEVKLPCIQLQCMCEFTPWELNNFSLKLREFYSSVQTNRLPEPVEFSPRIGVMHIELKQISDYGTLGFTFRIRPDMQAGSELTGGIGIDQSYFPQLLAGLRDIIEADQD